MSNKTLLRKDETEDFLNWLKEQNIDTRVGNGYELVQILIPNFGWQPIFFSNKKTEYYTVLHQTEALYHRWKSKLPHGIIAHKAAPRQTKQEEKPSPKPSIQEPIPTKEVPEGELSTKAYNLLENYRVALIGINQEYKNHTYKLLCDYILELERPF